MARNTLWFVCTCAWSRCPDNQTFPINSASRVSAAAIMVEQSRRDEIAQEFFDSLKFSPYPVQEEALLSWFTSNQGILVCAPTGTGKTLIGEAAIFEALKLNKTAYYTTPLIALTDQKFQEIREAAHSWGFSRDDIGLVTGNRKVNPSARVLVVVAEILLNRLLHREAFDFTNVWSVVMDEFHSFNDPERGIVWEFGLGLLPRHVKTLLLSATVGNSLEFVNWLKHRQDRSLELIQGNERKIPLSFQWVPDRMLSEQIEWMCKGDEAERRTPALIFCFNREECWTVAEMLKGKKVVDANQQRMLSDELDQHDWSQGAGPKMKQILIRGIGVHHAGVMPKYRRIVEDLFQKKLLSVTVCTETLAAGINLPARSVVLPTLMKGPFGKMKLIEPSSAHQMFGRAGRPQFDNEGFVFALPHEDDVKYLRWKEKFDEIPEDTKDPGLRNAKKKLKKKMPKRREGVQYWHEDQFNQLIQAPAGKLESRGQLPWRMLAYMLDASPEVEPIRQLVKRRLLEGKAAERAQQELDRMLLIMHRGGFVELDPKPPLRESKPAAPGDEEKTAGESSSSASQQPEPTLMLGQSTKAPVVQGKKNVKKIADEKDQTDLPPAYHAISATPTERMDNFLKLRGVNPLYGIFLLSHLGIADRNEKIQAIESILEVPRSVGKGVWVPPHEELPPGPLAVDRIDPMLLKLGLATAEEINGTQEDEERSFIADYRPPMGPLPLGYKLHRLFEYEFPGVEGFRVFPVWIAGEVIEFNGDFNNYITSKKLQKQEGIIFRHLLRTVLMIDEFAQMTPPELDTAIWQDELGEIATMLEETCLKVDPRSTEMYLEESKAL
jgi:superfamily II DNA/RNA helicase